MIDCVVFCFGGCACLTLSLSLSVCVCIYSTVYRYRVFSLSVKKESLSPTLMVLHMNGWCVVVVLDVSTASSHRRRILFEIKDEDIRLIDESGSSI